MPVKQEDNSIEELLTGAPETLEAGEIVIGQFYGLSPGGQALVDFAQNPGGQPIAAISTLSVNQGQSGRQVALMFVEGDLERPLIIGFIHSPLQEMIESFELTAARADGEELAESTGDEPNSARFADDVTIDGKKITLEAAQEMVLRCGNASITLTSAGKILIRGKYLLNRSSGVNRIVGGSVQVN